MSDTDTAPAPRSATTAAFTVTVLLAMAACLGYVRFVLLPAQVQPDPVAFDFRNPLLDARVGERVLMASERAPTREQCVVVREEGVQVRPHKGPARIGTRHGLRRVLPYLACSIRDVDAGGCGGDERTTVLYGLSQFGLPNDVTTVVKSIRPERRAWGDRELIVYRVTSERFGLVTGLYTTLLASEAPVAGLVGLETLHAGGEEESVTFRELVGPH